MAPTPRPHQAYLRDAPKETLPLIDGTHLTLDDIVAVARRARR